MLVKTLAARNNWCKLARVETVLELYYNQLKQGVEVIRDYQPLPPIWCYPDQLIQVWTI